MSEKDDARAKAEHAIRQANRAIKQGDLAIAEKWTKVAERLAAAADKLASLPDPVPDHETAEAVKAELRRRVMRFVEAAQANEEWEAEREAQKTGAVTRPKPYSDADLEAIGAGWDQKEE